MNEIKIIMMNPNDPPIVWHNDKIIGGIVSLNYHYDTSTNDLFGRHTFELKYIDSVSRTVRTATVSKTLADDIYPIRLEGSE